MCDRRLTVFTYPVLHIAPSFMRLKSILAKDVCDFGANISREVLLVGGVLTGVCTVVSSTASVLYRKPPPAASDSTLRAEKHGWQVLGFVQLVCMPAAKVEVTLAVPFLELSAICRVATLGRRSS